MLRKLYRRVIVAMVAVVSATNLATLSYDEGCCPMARTDRRPAVQPRGGKGATSSPHSPSSITTTSPTGYLYPMPLYAIYRAYMPGEAVLSGT